MPITTFKRLQHHPDWWYTVEDCSLEDDQPGSGLILKAHDEKYPEGRELLSIGTEDALLIRDAINQLYPPDKFKAP